MAQPDRASEVPLEITFDREADAAYISLEPSSLLTGLHLSTPSARVQELTQGINIHLDGEGRILGIEILGAKTLLPETLLSRAQDMTNPGFDQKPA